MMDIDAEGRKLDDPGGDRVGHLHVNHNDQHGKGCDNVDESGSTIEEEDKRILRKDKCKFVWSQIKGKTKVESVVDAD